MVPAMNGTDLELVGTTIDLVVILVAVSLFSYALLRGYLRSQVIPARGMVLITGGMVLAMLAHISDPLLQMMQPAGAEPVDFIAGSFLSGEKLNWLLSRLAFGLIAVGLLIAVLHRKKLESSIDEARTQAADAKQNEQLKASRLRYLFANTTDAVYCFRFDPPLPTDLPVREQIERSYDA
jgi:hypothetical protein